MLNMLCTHSRSLNVSKKLKFSADFLSEQSNNFSDVECAVYKQFEWHNCRALSFFMVCHTHHSNNELAHKSIFFSLCQFMQTHTHMHTYPLHSTRVFEWLMTLRSVNLSVYHSLHGDKWSGCAKWSWNFKHVTYSKQPKASRVCDWSNHRMDRINLAIDIVNTLAEISMNSFIIIIIFFFNSSGKSLSISTQNIIKMFDRNCSIKLLLLLCGMCGANFYWCTRNNCVRCVFAVRIAAGVDKWCSAIIHYTQLRLSKNAITNEFLESFSRRIISRRTYGLSSSHSTVHRTLLWIMYGSSMVHVKFIVLFHFIWGMNWMNINKPIHQLCGVCDVRVYAFAHPLTPNKITVYNVCQ